MGNKELIHLAMIESNVNTLDGIMIELAKRGHLISRKDIVVYLHHLKNVGLVTISGPKNSRIYTAINPIIKDLKEKRLTHRNWLNAIIDDRKRLYIKNASDVLSEVLKDA